MGVLTDPHAPGAVPSWISAPPAVISCARCGLLVLAGIPAAEQFCSPLCATRYEHSRRKRAALGWSDRRIRRHLSQHRDFLTRLREAREGPQAEPLAPEQARRRTEEEAAWGEPIPRYRRVDWCPRPDKIAWPHLAPAAKALGRDRTRRVYLCSCNWYHLGRPAGRIGTEIALALRAGRHATAAQRRRRKR